MWTQLYNDIEKFKFTRHCGFVGYWGYNGVEIEVVKNIFFPNELKLFVLDKFVNLNFIERRKLRKFVKELERLEKKKEVSLIKKLVKGEIQC